MSLIEAYCSMSLRKNTLILLHINLIWQLCHICWSIIIIAYLYSNPIEMQTLIQDADYYNRIYFIYTTTTIAFGGIYVSVLLSAILAIKMEKYSIYALAVVIVFTSMDLFFTYWRTLYWYIVNEQLQNKQLSNNVAKKFKNSSNDDNSQVSTPIFTILIFILSYLVFNVYSVFVFRVHQLDLLQTEQIKKKLSNH